MRHCSLARVAEVIARRDIDIDSLEQDPHLPKERVPFVITEEPVSEPTIRAAVDAINAFEFMVEPILLLRVELSNSHLCRRERAASCFGLIHRLQRAPQSGEAAPDARP